MGGFSIWHWLIVLLIVVMVFGTKKLRNMGGDLGMKDGGAAPADDKTAAVTNAQAADKPVDKTTIDVEAKKL